MEIAVTGRRVEITDEIRAMLEQKLTAALKVFPKVVRQVQVIVELAGYQYEVEAIVEVKTNKTITATAKDKELRSAIDAVERKVNEQMRRFKEKIENHHKHQRPARG